MMIHVDSCGFLDLEPNFQDGNIGRSKQHLVLFVPLGVSFMGNASGALSVPLAEELLAELEQYTLEAVLIG